MRRMLLAVAIAVVLLAPPMLAGGPEAFFAVASPVFTVDDSSRVNNGSFLGVKARLKARQALKTPTPNKLVETGGGIDGNETNVNINGLFLTPGAQLPRSVREIIIVGGRTADVTVTGRR